jgi:hypothetical protein
MVYSFVYELFIRIFFICQSVLNLKRAVCDENCANRDEIFCPGDEILADAIRRAGYPMTGNSVQSRAVFFRLIILSDRFAVMCFVWA